MIALEYMYIFSFHLPYMKCFKIDQNIITVMMQNE